MPAAPGSSKAVNGRLLVGPHIVGGAAHDQAAHGLKALQDVRNQERDGPLRQYKKLIKPSMKCEWMYQRPSVTFHGMLNVSMLL